MKPDISAPTIANLAYVLRHKEEWPDDFEWDFSSHYTCALGLLSKKWGDGELLATWRAAPMLGVNVRDINSIFLDENKDGTEILPEHIAARLEALNEA